MRIQHLLVLIAALAVVSCQKEASRQTTASGYEYVVHTDNGGQKPMPGDYVTFHAQMRNQDSVVISSRESGQAPSMQIPVNDLPGRNPSPVEEVLRLIGVGDSATVFIRIDTMPNKPMGFKDSDEIIYDLVLAKIQSADDYMAEQKEKQAAMDAEAAVVRERAPEVEAMAQETLAAYKAGSLEGELQTTPSGLKYIIHEQGSGAQAEAGKLVGVHYYGALASDGTKFDGSFSRGNPIEFPLGQGRVIPGWDEGIALLKEGAKATLFIPSGLAYGAAGSPPRIPADAELMFYVELVSAK